MALTQSITALLLIVVAIVVGINSVSAQWTQTGHDAQHSNHAPLGPANRTHTPLWTYPYAYHSNSKQNTMYMPSADTGIIPQPVVDENGVFYYVSKAGDQVVGMLPGGNATYTALDFTSSANKSFPVTSNLAALPSAPVTLVVTWHDESGHGRLVSFLPGPKPTFSFSTAMECQATVPVQFVGNPVIHPSGAILVTTRCGNNNETLLIAFSSALAPLWNVTLNANNTRPSVVAATGATGLIYVTDSATSVRAITSTGISHWNSTLPVDGVVSINSLTALQQVLVEFAGKKSGAGTYVLNGLTGQIVATYSKTKPLAQAAGSLFYAWYQKGSKDFRVVAVNGTVTNSSQPSFSWVSDTKFEDVTVSASVDGENVLYLYVAQPGKQQIYAFSLKDGKKLNGWPRTLFSGDKKHNRVLTFTPVVFPDPSRNTTRVLVPLTINKNETSLAFELLGCCSGNGFCNATKCTCTRDNYYDSACSTYCLASDTCNGNGKCNATGKCECEHTNFWDLKTYSGDTCSEIVNLTIFGGIGVAILFFMIIVFAVWVIVRSRRAAPVHDYASLSTVADPYN